MTSRHTERRTTEHTLKREFTFVSSVAFAFAFISPIVALYAIFGIALSAAGPSFWWGFFIVLAGQFLVALIFGTLVSRWPLEGSIYQWTSRLLGHGAGWFSGWFYIWTLTIAMATASLGAARFIANLFGIADPSGTQLAFIAFCVLIFGTIVNLAGRVVLKAFMAASIIAEIIGSIGLGVWLLVAHRERDFSVLFDNGASVGSSGDYFSLGGPFLLAIAFIGYSFVGFESAGSIAEEVKDPRRNLPKAMLVSIVFIAAVVIFSSLALILALPLNAQDLPGYNSDPVYAVLTAQLGPMIAQPLQALFAVGFIASFLALQTSASRLIWAKARDNALPASRFLSKLTQRQKQPAWALLVTGVIGTCLFLLSNVTEDLFTLMVNFTAGGFYLCFLFPIIGFAVAVFRKRWNPGPFSLKAWTRPLAVAALAWVLAQTVNIFWPRPLNEIAVLDWSAVIGGVALGLSGILVYITTRQNMTTVDTSMVSAIESAETLANDKRGNTHG